MSWKQIHSISFLILLLSACAVTDENGYAHLLKERNVKARVVTDIPFRYSLYRVDDTSCQLQINLQAENFLRMRDTSGAWYTAVTLDFLVQRNQFAGKQFWKDAKTIQYADTGEFDVQFNFILPEDKDLFYELRVVDENKHVYRLASSFWERSELFLAQDFQLKDSSGKVFNERIFQNEWVKLVSERWSDGLIKVEQYNNIQQPGKPIYQLLDTDPFRGVQPDSIYKMSLNEVNELINADLGNAFFKIYPIQGKSSRAFGISRMLNQNKIDPLIYMLGDQTELMVSSSVWFNFWTVASNNDPYKADKLIKEFSRRAKYANDFFTSYKQGWQTDRGMVYLLFGTPDRIIEDMKGEIWIYGYSDVTNKNFTFLKNPTGLMNNDFILERNPQFREFYLNAVQRWKNGWVQGGYELN